MPPAIFLLALFQPPNLAEEAQRAATFMRTGEFSKAAAVYERLAAALPGNAGLRLNLGLARFQAGEWATAVAPLESATRLDPKLAPAWLTLGLAHWKLGAPAKAVAPLERVLALEPGNSLARLELADAYIATSRAALARREFAILAKAEPGNPKAWQGLSLAYANLSREAFQAIEKAAPESGYWYDLLARSRLAEERYRAAFQLFRQALDRVPRLPGSHTAVALIYRQLEKPEWAATEAAKEPGRCIAGSLSCPFLEGKFEQVYDTAAGRPGVEALYWRARAATELSAAALARLDGLPPSPALHELRAQAYSLRGAHRMAVGEWEAALRMAPGEVRLERGLATSLARNQDCEAALPRLDRLATRSPRDATLALLRGDCHLRLLDLDAALPLLELAVQLDASLVPAHAALGRVLARLDRQPEAIAHLEKALPADEDGSLRLLLARALNRVGRADEAKRHLAESQRRRGGATAATVELTPP